MLDQGPENIFVFVDNIYACFSMSFMTSAASLRSNIRNVEAVFSFSVCFGFEPPNKLNFRYGAGALHGFM